MEQKEYPFEVADQYFQEACAPWQLLRKLPDLWKAIPFIPDLDKRIYEQITEKPETFHMKYWHSNRVEGYLQETKACCATVHCIAGWAAVFAGKSVLELIPKVAHSQVGALIFLKSTGSVPDFYATVDNALEEMAKRAGVER